MNATGDFWQGLREAQDEALTRLNHLESVRRQMPLRAPAPKRPFKSRAVALVAALGVAASVALVVSIRSHRSAMSFAVGERHEVGVIGAWIAAPDGHTLPLQFSDGTSVALDPGTRARVADTTPDGAHVVLERGRATASVVHRDSTKWRVDVGPFEVDVVGTAFNVSWDPAGEVLRLRLRAGQVVVSGSFLRQPTRVSQGQTLKAFCKEGRAELVEQAIAENEPDPTLIPEATTTEGTTQLDMAETAELNRPAPSTDVSSTRKPKWLELAAAGKYSETLALVERIGFDAECSRTSGRDLLTLGDAARLAGNAGRARQAYQLAREKLPGGGRASYTLGILAFNQNHDFTEAAKWFETYLREQPHGGLRREAMGRLLEAWQRAGERGKAAKIAQQYLVEYPTGAHAPLARQLTSQ